MSAFDEQHPRGHPTGRTRFAARESRAPELVLRPTPLLADTPIPVICPPGLTHVGALDPSQKKSVSQEGQGLSVSQHPDEWRNIALLKGDVWEFTKDDGQFLDYRQLSEAQVAAILAFGLERGYVRETPGFQLAYFDTSWGQPVKSAYFTREEAEEEAEFVTTDIGVSTVVTPLTILLATGTFPDTTVEEDQLWPAEILAAVWVSEEAPDLDGVWWQDELEDRRWAPRGVVVPARIGDWVAAARVQAPAVSD